MKKAKDTDRSQRKRKIFGLFSIFILIILLGAATWFIWGYFKQHAYSPELFREYIESFGWGGRLVALGIQFLQVVVALIPGEFVEIGMGYAFGAWEGALICMVGVLLGSALIFLVVRKWGVRLVRIFVNPDRINELRFINSEKKLKRTVFLLFFIPGTPKDLLTYFVGLTRIQLHEFLIISTIARIPSVLSSIIGGHFIGNRQYWQAVVLFAITGAISILGIILYNFIIKKHQQKKSGEAPPDCPS